MIRDSMVFYRSFAEGIEDLSEEDQLKAFWNLIHYGLDGKEPEDSGPARAVFRMARPQIDANNVRYQNGTRGGRRKTELEPNGNQSGTEPEPNPNQTGTKPEPNVYVNENDLKENTLKGVKEKRVAPPTLEEITAYCQEKGYSVDAERFVDFYASKGWMIGKNRMKDWRAAVRNWARGKRQGVTTEPPQRQGRTTKGNRFNQFEQREYSEAFYDSLMFGGEGNDGKSDHP